MKFPKRTALASFVTWCSTAWSATPTGVELDRLISTQGCPFRIAAHVDAVDGGFSSIKMAGELSLKLRSVNFFEKYRGSEPTIFKPSAGEKKGSWYWDTASDADDATEAKFLICSYGLDDGTVIEVKRELKLSIRWCGVSRKSPSGHAREEETYAYCR